MTSTERVWLSEFAVEDRRRLDATQERKLLWHADRLREDPTVGDQLRRDRIPNPLVETFACTNLWRLELPGGWRVLYTIQSRVGAPQTVSILRILDHAEYDRLLGYSTS